VLAALRGVRRRARIGRRDHRPPGVLIIVENLPVPFDRRVWQEATALRDAGWAVSVISPANAAYRRGRYELDGILVWRHPLPAEARSLPGFALEYSVATLYQAVLSARILFARGFDVIHACNPPDTIFAVALPYKALLRKRFVFDHHDLSPELYLAKGGRRGGLVHRALLVLERLTFATADVVIATNESYREVAKRRGRKAPEDVAVVRSGPDLARVAPRPPDARWRGGREFLVAYVGVIGQQEGLQYLVGAVEEIALRRGRTDVQFVVVGDGPHRAEVERLAAERGVASFITFTGRVPDETLLTVLSTADVCVNCDEVNEMNDLSTMNKVLEYMALGRPIVQFEVTEGRRSAGEASLYARPNDATDFACKILELLESPERRCAMGAEGRRRIAEGLSWEHQRPRLLEAYGRLGVR
jgi:glycosyltransferase involved in cell wall biosynthesis